MANDKRRSEGWAEGENTINLFNAYGLKDYGNERAQGQAPKAAKKASEPRRRS